MDDPLVLGDGRRVIAVDFDGVIHDYRKWLGPCEINGVPYPGAIEWLRRLLMDERVEVVIHTARAQHPDAAGAIRLWLVCQGLERSLAEWLQVTASKVAAHVYCDDRGLRFEEQYPDVENLLALSPWWART